MCEEKKAKVTSAVKAFKKSIAPMQTRIYPRSLTGPQREHCSLPGNQKRRAFTDVLQRQLELGLTTVHVTTNH